MPNGTGLPKSFVLAVTRTHVHALEDKRHRDELAPGRVIKSWARAGFRAHTGGNAMAALGKVPDDRQLLMLFLPIDGDSSRVAQAIAQQRAAAGQRIPGHPYPFYIGKDAASQRLVAALGAQPLGAPGGAPSISISENANIRIGPAANITVGGQRLQDLMAKQAQVPEPPSRPSAAPTGAGDPARHRRRLRRRIRPQASADHLRDLTIA